MYVLYPLRDSLHEALRQLRALSISLPALPVCTSLRLLQLIAERHPQLGRDLDLLRRSGRLTASLAAQLLALGDDLLVGARARAAAPGAAGGGQAQAHGVAGVEAADLAAGARLHEGAQGDEGGAHAPGGLPRLLVVARDAEADLAVRLEAPARRREAEGRRAQRVRRRQHDAPVVDALCEGGFRRPAQREVPLEEVGFEGRRRVVGGWRVGDLGGLAHYSSSEVSLDT